MQRHSRDRKKPETYVAEPASVADGRGRGRLRGRGRPKGRGRGRGRARSEEVDASEATPAPVAEEFAVQNKQDVLGRRLKVHWDQEEEDFEGYVRDYKPSETFPYQVAYDDSDDEWGYFTPTHFHTDEVNRKYSWLPDQDAVIAKAVATLNEQQESKGSKADADQSAPLPKSNSVPPSAAPSAGPKPIPLSLAAQKSLLRANKPATERGSASYDRPDADAQTVPTTNGKARFTSTEQQQPAATKVTSIKPDVKAAAVLQKSIAEAKSKAARSDPDEEASIAPNKRRKVSPGPDSNTPPKKRPSTSSMLADAKHLVHMRSKPTAPAALGAATAASSPVAQLSLQPAKDAQHQAEPKRRRLQKLSDASAAAQQAEPASDAEVKPENSQVLAVAVLKGISSEGVTNSGNNGQQTPAALPDKPSASEQLSAMPVTEPDGMVLASRAAQQPGHAQAAKPVSLKDAEAKSDTMYVKLEEPSEIAEPEAKPVQPAHAAVSDKELQLAQDGLPDSVQLHKSPSLPAVKSSTKSASPTQQQIAEQPPSNSPRPPTLLSQPTSVAPPTMPLRASKLPLPATASSTRIAMPRGLTSLSSLRTADSIPILKTEAVSSPAVASEPATGSSSAAELAKSEGELQATMQQFEDLLQNTLQRTKEGVHRVREFVLKAAGNPNGKVAARRLIIMVLDYIETAQMHKRIDLFYLMDSLLQASLKEAKPGSETRTEALKIVTKVIAAGLHRIAQAMGQDSECISKASKVFEIWQRRQILKASVVAPALQLLAKLRAEHAIAQAGAEPVVRMGQAMDGRRPMRVNLPCVPPGSHTGLPKYVMHLMLDQWAGLAGFRFQRPDGRQMEFKVKPQWMLSQQARLEDWDRNPASAQLSQAEVLADAAVIREQHLDVLELQREAKEKRERSPWGQENPMPEESPDLGYPLSPVQQEDIDMDEAQSPDQGHSGYLSTDANSTWHFEPPRAPVHQGISGESPPYGSYGSASAHPQQWPWGHMSGMTHVSSMGHLSSMGHMPLQHSQSMYDPLSSQVSLQQPRMQHLTAEHMPSESDRQRPHSAEHWYNVPFDEGSQQPPVQQTSAGQAQVKSLLGQAVHASVAVRDSNTDFDADTNWSDDDVPPPLPAEPAPPLPESLPPLPAEPSPGALPPLPPDEDQPPLPPSEATETRLATAGLFEPATHAATEPFHPQLPPMPSTGIGFNYGF